MSKELTLQEAKAIAEEKLAEQLPKRWVHVQGVAAKAAEYSQKLNLTRSETEQLISSAWLHDIGYSPDLPQVYKWHPLDGAHFLKEMEQEELACLVAWHSTAQEESERMGLTHEMLVFPRPHGIVADALTFCDMTTSATGIPCTLESRLTDIRTRHGAYSSQAQSMEEAWERLQALQVRITSRLAQK